MADMGNPGTKKFSDLTAEELEYTNAPVLAAQVGTLFAIGLVVVLARSYSRVFIVKSFGSDDWTIALAMLFGTMCFILYMIQLSVGVGSYAAVIEANEAGLKVLFLCRQITHICLVAGISLVKISVAFFLLRLATARPYYWFLWGMIVFLVTFTLVCWGTLIFQCLPVRAAWDMKLRPPPMGTGNAKCFSPMTFKNIGLFNGVTNIITDFILALLPVPLIWTLQMKLRARISLVLILGLGTFAAVAGIVRQLITPDYLKAEPWIDDSYTMWNFTEMYTGIIAASLPGVKPLFSWFYDTALSRRPGNSSAYKSPNTLGYRKQSHPYDRETFALEPYAEGQTVQVTTLPKEKTEWDMEHAKSSEESILTHGATVDRKRGIRVTREVQIE